MTQPMSNAPIIAFFLTFSTHRKGILLAAIKSPQFGPAYLIMAQRIFRRTWAHLATSDRKRLSGRETRQAGKRRKGEGR
jgi:hypothetical protein